MRRIPPYAVVVIVVAGLLCSGTALAQVASTFDADREGWFALSHNTASWQAGTGNLGGCLRLEDRVLGASHTTVASAPAKFLGDWSGFGAGDSLALDIWFDNIAENPPDTTRYRITISGPGGSARALTGAASIPPESLWTSFAVSFDPADWVVDSGTWGELLTQITSLYILGEYATGLEEVKLDNVRLTATPVPVITRCMGDAFNTTGSTEDFSFQDVAEALNNSTQGNGGGFVVVSDLGGLNSYAYVPSRYLGDWRPYEGTGWISLDVRVVTAGSELFDSPDFVRIAGPGGAAYVSVVAADLPHGLRKWKTYEIPIDSTAWTLESGTWSALIAYIEECRIDLEYYYGTEVIGLDNFGRLSPGCGWIDNPVNVEKPDFWFRGYHSLITPASVVYNPLDTLLYAVVAQTVSSGGGLYYVTGGSNGTRRQVYEAPSAALAAADGDMFVTEVGSGNVFRLEYGGASSVWVSGFHSSDDDPVGMAFAPAGFNGTAVSAGDVIVVDIGSGGPDEIWTFSPEVAEGEQLLVPDPGSRDWIDVASSSGGQVFVCDVLESDSVFALSPDGTMGGIALDTPIERMVGIVYDDVGQVLYVASDGSRRDIYRVNPASGAVTRVFSGFTDFAAVPLDIDAASRRLFVADVGYHRIYELEISPVTGVREQATPPAPALQLRVIPNPFNPSTTIHFVLTESAPVRLDIYNAAGRLVRRLAGERLGAGPHAIPWNGRNGDGAPVASGVYFARCVRDDTGVVATARLVLVK
jgi:hypothetical protein